MGPKSGRGEPRDWLGRIDSARRKNCSEHLLRSLASWAWCQTIWGAFWAGPWGGTLYKLKGAGPAQSPPSAGTFVCKKAGLFKIETWLFPPEWGNHHLQGNVQVHNVRIPEKGGMFANAGCQFQTLTYLSPFQHGADPV